MKAAQVTALVGPSAIVVRDVAEPPRPPGKVLIEVHAAGVIFPDVLKSQGRYQDKPALPFVCGHQASGVVLAAPAGAPVRVGDRIVALTESGAFAERAVADPERVFPLPDAMSFAAGAAAPINYLTTHFALSWRARLQAGETVLVHGAAGGLGSAAVQYARVLGARVIAVVSTPEKAVLARRSGAHETVAADGFLTAVRELTSGRGVDVVFDTVGGDRFSDSLRSLRTLGRLLVLGFAGGAIPALSVNRLLLRNVDVVGIAWGEFWATQPPDYPRRQWAALLPLFESGELAPIVGAVFPLAEVGAAVTSLAQRQALGNVIVTVR
jgi:NADPH2:quinone reductase